MVSQVSWYFIPISIIISFIILGIVLYIIVKRYLNKWKNELSLNMKSLCKIYNIPPITLEGFFPDKFDKQHALSLLMLNYSVTSWSGCQTNLPKIDNFIITKTFQGYDSKANKNRDIAALYYSQNLNMVIMSFSGTMYISEWDNDFDFTQVNPKDINKDNNILVHEHDYEMYNSLRNGFIIALNDIISSKSPEEKSDFLFIATGHSLGGALSSLCFFDIVSNNIIKENEGYKVLYTFGSPRVGNSAFADIINKEPTAFRVANSEDIITTLPLPIVGKTIYEHTDTCISFSMNLNNYTSNHIDSYIKALS